MSRRKKTINPVDYVSVPEIKLSHQAKKSLVVLAIFTLGLISLLGLFNLSGRLGSFLSKELMLGFGYGKWIWPFILILAAWFIYRGKQHRINFFHYFGIFCWFIAYQTLFHFFYEADTARAEILLGHGGGYIGYYLSLFFQNILGFWGGLIVLIILFFVALVLIFNTSISHIVGRQSWLYKTFSSWFGSASKSDEPEELEATGSAALFQDHLPTEAMDIKEAVASEALTKVEETVKSPEPLNDFHFKEKPIVDPLSAALKFKSVKIDLPIELLKVQTGQALSGDIDRNRIIIQHTLENFGIPVEMGETSVGPTVTQYTFKPADGIKLARITALSNDLSLALAAHPIRIEAPIPGKALVGIEVPNKTKAIVGLRSILEDKSFKSRRTNLLVALGKDVAGGNWLYDLTKMPHLLVAGATNSGKSVCLNAIIVSLLYQNSPETLRFIMIDPKRVELPAYNGIPHLLTPVITEVNKTINSLKWCMNEMDRRYDLLNKAGKKNIQSYNSSSSDKMPYIVFIIDELADLMVAAGKDIEGSIIRLTQMSRAVGIHLILATQRPSVDVITGLIKANIPARAAFAVASAVDSKTILDFSGAEKLLGKGDMLFSVAELSKPKRLQGAFVDDDEINAITNYIKEKSGEAEYLEGVTERQKVAGVAGVGLDGTYADEDELAQEAKDIVIKMGRASTSLLQRRLRIGYGRAASILDGLEEAGIVGPSNGSKPREILVSKDQYEASQAMPFAGMSLHDRSKTNAPDSYLEEGNDDTLEFEAEEEIEEEIAEEAAPEEAIPEIEEKNKIKEVEIKDDDDWKYFSR